MKYVVILSSYGVESPIILPEWMNHSDVIQPHHKVVSAGFCRFHIDQNETQNVNCWGRSHTLNIGNRGTEDEELLLRNNEFSA